MLCRRSGELILALAFALAGPYCTAQQRQAAHTVPAAAPQVQLLAADEGLSVLASALDFRNRASDNADCSHLVHDVYERAGFSYSYVPSSNLYAGIAEFRRVSHPQPGDLIVWPGHVGIVISPVQHSFYSSLNSGWGVESYDAAYWVRRGRPRFYRYVKSTGATQMASAKPAALKPVKLEAKPTIELTPINDEEPVRAAVPQPKAVDLPTLALLDSERPTASEATEAIVDILGKNTEALAGKDLFSLKPTVVVVTRVAITRLKIKGAAGWAEVQVAESASLAQGQLTTKKRQEKQRWTMVRRDQAWELLLPQNVIYLLHDDAARLIAQQLATMTSANSSSDSHQKAQLAELLGALLQVKN